MFSLPKAGFGTTQFWYGTNPDLFETMLFAVQEGGINLIDTAEMYGDGRCEEAVGELIRTVGRNSLCITDKILPEHANSRDFFASLDRSLTLLGTDYIDLYLLHWRGDTDLSEVAACMEDLKAKGRIRRWGVSNFDVQDMEDLWRAPDGQNCCVNQILYNLGSRGVEYDLVPWQRERGIPFMAYCPVGQAGALITQDRVSKEMMVRDPNVRAVAERHGCSIVQVLLAFVLRLEDFAAMPKAVSFNHIEENYAVRQISLTEEDIEQLSRSFPSPKEKIPMEKY